MVEFEGIGINFCDAIFHEIKSLNIYKGNANQSDNYTWIDIVLGPVHWILFSILVQSKKTMIEFIHH